MMKVTKGRVGQGWRYCNGCGHSTRGTRSIDCGNCGVRFDSSVKKPAKKVAKAKPSDLAQLTQFKKTMKELRAFISYSGGEREAVEIVKRVQQLCETFGSTDEVVECLNLIS